MKQAYIVDGIRTPIGNFGGSLSSIRTDDLATLVIQELVKRNPQIPADVIDDVILGCHNQAGEDNRNVARMALLMAGLPTSIPGETVNRLCASGMSAVMHAAHAIKAGEGDVFIAGGVENMTRGPWVISKSSKPFGTDAQMFDSSFGWRFINPKMHQMYGTDAMGATAENLVDIYNISREDQDQFAYQSHKRAAKARDTGRFAEETVPVEIQVKKGETTIFKQDEFIKDHTTIEKLAQLKPISVFDTGEVLAKAYCATCHLFPEPSLLDKTTWKERVLPNMGWRLGIRKAGDNPYAEMEKDEAQLVMALNIFPDKALLPFADWQKIVAYYLQKAPDKPLPQKTAPTFDSLLNGFHADAISFTKIQLPQTSLLKYDTTTSLLFIGDGQSELYAMRSNLKLLASWKLESAPVDIDLHTPGSPWILCIGSVKPTQKKTGSFYALDSTNNSVDGLKRLDKLARPVACELSDLNADGKKDVIICQFGHHTGKLSWFDGGDPGKEHVLKSQPGARRVEVHDFNGDGKPDIMALMAQAREELNLFINQGQDKFSEKTIYQFPPVYGVSYFELADFNRDGHPDILLTNGDNWDLSPIKKYYHGIRILMNDGKNNFKIAQFFPFYGASKAVARDFDRDGDLDIAAIAFYDDPKEQAHTFLYLENKGSLTFSSASTPAAENGKWITLEACDLDRDGNQDIILGSFVYTVGELTKLLTKGVESFPQMVILWNDRK